MDPQPSLEHEWQNYCDALYPCADAATVAELRRTFFAGALVLEMLAFRAASEKGLLLAPHGSIQDLLEALKPLREELRVTAEGLAQDPEDGA